MKIVDRIHIVFSNQLNNGSRNSLLSIFPLPIQNPNNQTRVNDEIH